MTKTRKWKRQNYLMRKAERERRKRKRRRQLTHYERGFINKKLIDSEGFYNIQPPENFSLINNPNELLKYFDEAKSVFHSRNKVYFGLQSIKKMTPDAIALMAAKLSDKSFTRSKTLRGGAPKEPELKEMFKKSGFYNFFNSKITDQKFPEGKALRYRSNKKVSTMLAVQICEEAIRHTLPEEEKIEPVYEILIECMDNTHDHADPKVESVYNWWLFLYKDPSTKISYFSFLDLGVGIFDNLSITGAVTRIQEILGVKNKVDFVDPLINGNIASITGKSERGKGWPHIYKNVNNSKLIHNFTLVSNNVYANLSTGKRQKLKCSLRGTFIYWEVHPNM